MREPMTRSESRLGSPVRDAAVVAEILRGGHAIVFVDPMAETLTMGSQGLGWEGEDFSGAELSHILTLAKKMKASRVKGAPPVDPERFRYAGPKPQSRETALVMMADAVEAAVQAALPGSDVVVHVEPLEDVGLRERAHAAAISVPGVREVHNLALVEVDGRTELSLHLKLPGEMTLEAAHDVAETLERTVRAAVPEVDAVQTHLEPLTEPSAAHEVVGGERTVERIVIEATGQPPRTLRFLRTASGLVAFLTLALEGSSTLADAHARASLIEEQIRRERPDIDEVIVHTEP